MLSLKCFVAALEGRWRGDLLLVGLRADIFKDVGNAQLELVSDGGHPGVILCLEHLLGSRQVQVTYKNE